MGKTKPKRPKKKPTHGGARAGAGRKPIDGVGTLLTGVSLTPAQIEKVQAWRGGLGRENFSAAVREMIDRADQVGPPPSS